MSENQPQITNLIPSRFSNRLKNVNVIEESEKIRQFLTEHIDEIQRILDLMQSLLDRGDGPRIRYLKGVLSHIRIFMSYMYPLLEHEGSPAQVPGMYPPAAPDINSRLRDILERLKQIEKSPADVKNNWSNIFKNIKNYEEGNGEKKTEGEVDQNSDGGP